MNKRMSWKYAEPRVRLADVVPLDTPFLVIIDVANVCNFKCEFCFQSVDKDALRDMGFKPHIMDMPLFKKAVDEVRKFPSQVKRLYMFAHGESLLNKNLPDMISYAKEQDIAKVIQLTTNGSLLSPELNLKLIDAGLDELRISIEGLSAEKYREVAAVDIDFDAFVKNIEHFYMHRGSCKVYVKAINIALEDGEEDKFFNLFENICDNISIEYLTPYYEGVDYSKLNPDHGKTICGDIPKKIDVCPRLFYMLNICPDGNVTMCNVDNLEQYVIGNVKTDSLFQLWNGKELNALRIMHLQKKGRTHPFCSKCVCLDNCTQESDILDEDAEAILKRVMLK